MQREMLFWIWLSEKLGAASRDFRRLIELYETPYDLFHAEEAELDRIEGITPRTAQVLADKSLQRATEILDACEHQDIGILPYGDPLYPAAFYELKSPPVLLYYMGQLEAVDKRLLIGMVGTRKMSAYGLRSAYKISYELASAGAIVVSGMAAGIDGVSAAAAIAAKGKTVAILGCGLDVVYPKHHKALRDEILKNGILFSEYPPGARPNPYHFPVRNRLIAALSQATVVVEAGIGSGSLITAKDAILMGKDVFALPANVGSSGAEGTNGLLRDGARLLLKPEDILNRYLYSHAETLSSEALHRAEEHSCADMHLLDRLGVIELTSSEASPKPAEKAVAPTAKKPSRTKESKVRNEKTESACDEPKAPSDDSAGAKPSAPDAVLSSLSPVQLAVMEAIPDEQGITADALASIGYPYGEIVSALTMLEILGLIQKLPGAIYVKI